MAKEFQVNEQIRADVVKLVLGDGRMKGLVSKLEALEIARNQDLDLVQVSKKESGKAPVCKLLDYGKLKYEANKKRKQRVIRVKEMRLHFMTSQHDVDIKHKKINKFLDKKYKVKYRLELKGREKHMIDIALSKLNEYLSEFNQKAKWDEPSISYAKGRAYLSTVLNPI